MNRLLGLLATLGLGMALGRLFDRERGRRRRALLRDKLVSAAHTAGDAIDTTSRDVTHRTRGVVASLRSRLAADQPSDAVLVERVRSKLGGLVSHPSAIEVTAARGWITLRGPVLAHEVDRLVKRIVAVRGVRSVDNRLDVHAEAGNVPGLQGTPGPRRAGGRFGLGQRHWSPTARLLTGLAGGGLGLFGLRRPGLVGTAVTTAGATLLARAATNLELRRLLGVGRGRRAIDIQKTIEVAAPVEDVFALWSRYENFPRFMSHVREVRRLDGDRSHWTVAGPGGIPIEWDTETTAVVRDRVIAWKTIEGAPVAHAGIVRFEPTVTGGTRIHLRMSYNPPAGAVGHALAAILGGDPKRAMDDDLVRLKSLLEEGRTRGDGPTVRREQLG